MNVELNELMSMPMKCAVTPEGGETFVPEKVCAKQINYAIEGDKLSHVTFVGGCEGNLKALSSLLEGMEIDKVVEKMQGITCGKKDTSCVDQLSKALMAYKETHP